MAWRIDRNVVKGIIYNHLPGRVIGKIWLKGLNAPIKLDLKGNCHRDLAGTKLVFRNPQPIESDYTGLDILQTGVVGDMTASKKVKLLANPDILEEQRDNSEVAYTWKNCLYIEWFSESNGRLLIESVDFQWQAGLPTWNMSPKEDSEQRQKNQKAMFNFIDQLSKAIDLEEDDLPEDDEMDEFQWEAFLQKSDARSDMLLELFEKYEDDPNCEEIIAEAMGWEIENEQYEQIEEEDWEEAALDDSEEPYSEINDSDYLPSHPLITSTMELTSRIFYETESRKLLTDDTNNPWNQVIWHAQMTVSKLIAALEEVAEGIEPEPGFVVATLKRALHLVHLTIATLEAAVGLEHKGQAWSTDIRKDLFSIRESILNLMQTFRSRGN